MLENQFQTFAASTPIGHHVTLDLYECQCPVSRLAVESEGRDFLNYLATKFHPLGLLTHQFEPHGYSGLVLLAESHISIHTWPEKGFVSMDLYTCDGKIPEEAILDILSFFIPQSIERNDISRGVSAHKKEMVLEI